MSVQVPWSHYTFWMQGRQIFINTYTVIKKISYTEDIKHNLEDEDEA